MTWRYDLGYSMRRCWQHGVDRKRLRCDFSKI